MTPAGKSIRHHIKQVKESPAATLPLSWTIINILVIQASLIRSDAFGKNICFRVNSMDTMEHNIISLLEAYQSFFFGQKANQLVGGSY